MTGDKSDVHLVEQVWASDLKEGDVVWDGSAGEEWLRVLRVEPTPGRVRVVFMEIDQRSWHGSRPVLRQVATGSTDVSA